MGRDGRKKVDCQRMHRNVAALKLLNDLAMAAWICLDQRCRQRAAIGDRLVGSRELASLGVEFGCR